ncbi:MAG: DUF2092 domain-containing protein [Candidatus Omnitrophota bacterium]
MMRFPKRTLILFVLLGFSSPLLWCAPKAGSGEDILQETARAYRGLKTYQAVVLTTMEMGKTVSTRSTLAVERPNRLALLTRSVMSGITLISDGKRIYVYLPASGKYTVKDAPEDFEMFAEVLGPDLMAQGDNCSLYGFLGLLKANPYQELTEGVEKIRVLGEENLDGTKTRHLRLEQKGGIIDLWIDATNYLIRKIRVEVDVSKVRDTAGETEKTSLPADDRKIIVAETHKEVKVNEPIPSVVFTFTPPEGAQETDDFLSLTSPDTAGWETRSTVK